MKRFSTSCVINELQIKTTVRFHYIPIIYPLYTYQEWSMAIHFIFLPGESQGQSNLVGYHPYHCTESDTAEATQQQQHIPIRMSQIQNSDNTTYCENWERSFIASRNAGSTVILEDSLAISYKTKHTLTIQSSNYAP